MCSLVRNWKEFLSQFWFVELKKFCAFYIIFFQGNKVDKSDAASEPDLRYALQLDNSLTGKATPRQEGVRPVELFMCSVVKKYGYTDAFKWLAKRIP